MTATVVGVPTASNIYGVTDVHANVAVASAIALDYAVVILLLSSPSLSPSCFFGACYCLHPRCCWGPNCYLLLLYTVQCSILLLLVFPKVLASILMLFATLMFQLSLVLL
jgi:hypothetical protein